MIFDVEAGSFTLVFDADNKGFEVKFSELVSDFETHCFLKYLSIVPGKKYISIQNDNTHYKKKPKNQINIQQIVTYGIHAYFEEIPKRALMVDSDKESK